MARRRACWRGIGSGRLCQYRPADRRFLAIDKPTPEPDELTRFYWEGARRHELMVLRCADCGYYLHPPEPACPRCHGRSLEPTAVSGRGSIFSFTVARQAFDVAFLDHLPYVLALIELAEQPGLRILTNVVEDPPEALEVGAAVEVTFEARGGWSIPQFRLAREA